MKRVPILVLMMALGAAVLVALLTHSLMAPGSEPKPEAQKPQSTAVLVATNPIASGEKLGAAGLAWRDWPIQNLNAEMITKDAQPDALDRLGAARARTAFVAGEPIFEAKVMQGEGGFLSSLLTPGMRAIAVGISERSGVSGFVLPDDRVDVILTRRESSPAGGDPNVTSETVLTNVRVLAVNQTFRQNGDLPTIEDARTAVLELDPIQAEVISKIQSAGEISLALRSMVEGDGSSLRNARPELADAYKNRRRSASSGPLIIRYGVEETVTYR